MILPIYFSKNYFHFNNSLFYNEYIVILTFLFVATILSVVIVLFSFKLNEKRKTKFFLEADRARHESCEDLTAIRRQRNTNPWKLVVNIWVKQNINLRQGDPETQASAQIYLTNNIVSRPAPEYRLKANRGMAYVGHQSYPEQDVVNEVKLGWHLYSPSGWHSNLHTWEIEADNFDLNVRPLTPNEPVPQFGITKSIITVRD